MSNLFKSQNRLNNFTIVDNKYIVNSGLSLQAIGLYTFMCSKPEMWTFSYAGLGSQLNESVKTLKKIVKELVLAHAIVRVRTTMTTKEGHKYPSYDWIINPNENDVALALQEDPVLSLLKNGGTQNGGTQNGGTQNGGTQNGGDIVITNPSNKEESKKEISKEVVDYFNSKLGTKYKYNNKFVQEQISNGYSAKQMIKVIDKKYDDWYGEYNEQYLRPSTLFGDKFEEYLNTKSKQSREKVKKFVKEFVNKVEKIVPFMENNPHAKISKLKSNKQLIFNNKEIELLGLLGEDMRVVSLFKQKELEQEAHNALR